MMAGAKETPSHEEKVAHRIVNREEPLGLRHPFEAPHVVLAPARRLV